MKTHELIFQEQHRRTFDLLLSGEKNIETRAGGTGYEKIKIGDVINFVCGQDMFARKVKNVVHFDTVDELCVAYNPHVINLDVNSCEELKARYDSFGYENRIREYGMLAFILEDVA